MAYVNPVRAARLAKDIYAVSDVFLIFRGTTKGVDWVTDARMGLNVSSTGSLVHSGFNQTFNSMKSEMAQFTIPLKCWLLRTLRA